VYADASGPECSRQDATSYAVYLSAVYAVSLLHSKMLELARSPRVPPSRARAIADTMLDPMGVDMLAMYGLLSSVALWSSDQTEISMRSGTDACEL
jgi:hypothetical protein